MRTPCDEPRERPIGERFYCSACNLVDIPSDALIYDDDDENALLMCPQCRQPVDMEDVYDGDEGTG